MNKSKRNMKQVQFDPGESEFSGASNSSTSQFPLPSTILNFKERIFPYISERNLDETPPNKQEVEG